MLCNGLEVQQVRIQRYQPICPRGGKRRLGPNNGNQTAIQEGSKQRKDPSPSSGTKPATVKAPKQLGYKGSNFNPNYSQSYRERSQLEKKSEERQEPRK
jgi:hypothetical protein